jgi:hypothetical protein
MNSLMVERFLSEMKDSEQLKFSSPQEKLGSSTSMVSINTAMPLFKNVTLMSEKIFSKTLSYQEDQPCSTVWERECGKKSINLPQVLIKSRYWPLQKGSSVYGLEVPSWQVSVLSKQCG